MDDDFNTGAAIGLLFELVNRLNKLADSAKLDDAHAMMDQSSRAEFREGASLLRELSQILGITLKRHDRPHTDHDHLVSELLNMLIDIRNHLRQLAKSAPKDHPVTKSLYEHADQIRKRLHHLGVTIEDRNTGTTWRLEK
jgi:cysteinyl-tRNA synthetase